MTGLPITDLVFKGTHNSYACFGQSTPTMGHPPRQQIDDFGVWSVELDFAIKSVAGVLRAVVGHDDEDDSSCWGHFLRDYIQAIHLARARPYRLCSSCSTSKNGATPTTTPPSR